MKWEYKVLAPMDSDIHPFDLRDAGEEGWELVAVYFNTHGYLKTAIFKRRKEEQ